MRSEHADKAAVLLLGLGPTTLSALEALSKRFHVVGLVRAVIGQEAADGTVLRARALGVPVHTDARS
jgi:hypothetical protein